MRSALGLVLLLINAHAACAHDLWITRAGEGASAQIVVNYGHPGDRPPPLADKVLSLDAITPSSVKTLQPLLKPAVIGGAHVAAAPFQAASALIAARYDNGFWSKLPDGSYRNVSRLMVPDAADTIWSSKYAKAIFGIGAPWDRVLGHPLEIVPLGDSSRLRVGEVLRVRVQFRGKPLANADVERGDGFTIRREDDVPKFRSDADGVSTIPLQQAGLMLLAVDHSVTPSSSPALADRDLYNATLALTVAAGK